MSVIEYLLDQAESNMIYWWLIRITLVNAFGFLPQIDKSY